MQFYGEVMVQKIGQPHCKCGSIKLQRIRRRSWIRLLPWTTLYVCRRCGRKVLTFKARKPRKIGQKAFLFLGLILWIAFILAVLEYNYG